MNAEAGTAERISEQALEAQTASIREAGSFVAEVRNELGKRIVGQHALLDRVLMSLLTGGHILLEGVPGLAKTLTVSTLAEAIHTTFKRIQFTPDLLPADVVGTLVWEEKTGSFTAKRGPIFANIVLADEINRAPAKVQSALLEAMQERQVTIGEETHPLPVPFLVMATQNPIEHEGTYPLPEAQVDRFMFKTRVDYPEREEERSIMRLMAGEDPPPVEPVVEPARILAARAMLPDIYLDQRLEDYILALVLATRDPANHGLGDLVDSIEFGASPRATIYLARAARAHAFLESRAFVIPEDVKAIARDVLRHRLVLTFPSAGAAARRRAHPGPAAGDDRGAVRLRDLLWRPLRPAPTLDSAVAAREVRRLELQSRRFMDNPALGPYPSLFRGQGIEFSEVREYQPGRSVPGDRLEGDGPHAPPLREALRRGARVGGPARRRRVGLERFRHAPGAEARSRGGSRERARPRGDARRRSRRHAPVHRSRRALRAARARPQPQPPAAARARHRAARGEGHRP